MKAIWNNQIIAESDDIINIEGNMYFPIESVKKEYLRDSDTKTHCHWKGEASYYSLRSNGNLSPDAAWYYAEPRPLADGIQGRVAFWKDVQLVRD